MARRYVPKTYNNHSFLRFVAGGVATIVLTIILLFVILFFIFQSYVVEGQLYIPWLTDETPPPIRTPEPIPEPTVPPSPSPSPTPDPEEGNGEEGNGQGENGQGEENIDPPERYTIEQIQTALEAQFRANALGGRSPQIVAYEQVARDRDSIQIESAEGGTQTVDLSNSRRYKVEIRFEQPVDEFNIWEEINRNVEDKPYRRDGRGHTILTDYFYFNDEEGVPVLAFIEN